MQPEQRITLIGNTPSPYTRKMVALLRYRRIPYAIIWQDPTPVLQQKGIAAPKVALLPTFIFADEAGQDYAAVDSTPIIRKLEHMFSNESIAQRSVIPHDPALAFIDYLLEDFADEWCTKYMFHYRWHFARDADNAGTLLPLCIDPALSSEQLSLAKAQFSRRQIDRLYVVGSNDTTAPLIDASYRRLLTALEAHFAAQSFLLGARPSAADFGLFGQLSQLIGFDPTPRDIAHELAPRAVAWSLLTEDLSGLEVDDTHWNTVEALPKTLNAILQEVGRVYVPAMLANARAVQTGAAQWQTQIDGALWEQQTFVYQAKCLQWINEQYQALSPDAQRLVMQVLAGTGCEALLEY